MGIYLGQLPPAEVARLKAELAETLIANFCYPRFFDSRTSSLRVRPVDRAKRHEVWLYLSSIDFTAWNCVDLMSPDFQHQMERLFIMFVQRNRSFFGEQGRKRMSDIRMLINTSSSSLVLGLRNHITGQKQGSPPFGSPRPTISWSTNSVSGRSEPSWEQIGSMTMQLQQQIQELRGEIQPVAANGATRRTSPSMAVRGNANTFERNAPSSQDTPSAKQASARAATSPQSARGTAVPSSVSAVPTAAPLESPVASVSSPAKPAVAGESLPPPETVALSTSTSPVPVAGRGVKSAQPSTPATTREASMMMVGEDDIAIFEQMRHQLMMWLRIEVVTAGLEISNQQAPAQLLELLRQQGRLDETRLQVVSTLLNLANQVIKTRLISILDYKQALMFHLMHTRKM